MKHLRKEKGVAGLEILISLIATLFVVGILVMAFILAGSKMEDAVDDGEAEEAINETKTAIADVTDWFSTFIVIGAIVVLVLLIVLVIVAIRRAGLMGGEGA
jgi:quinol-cytochrome oxidoreductase complex cytochrome b subunit